MILVVGGNSMIGRSIVRLAGHMHVPCAATSRKPGSEYFLDLAGSPASWNFPKEVRTAVFCASITDLASCEKNPRETYGVNVTATTTLMDRLASRGTKITFLSSNLVFGPNASAPSEHDVPNPATEYGRQKLTVENHLLQEIPESQIIRLTKVVSPELPLFLRWIDAMKRNIRIAAFSDLFLSPLAVSVTASIVFELSRSRQRGIFHFSASDSMSYFDMAKWLTSRYNFDPTLVVSTKAPHPNSPDSCRLNCKRAQQLGFNISTSLDGVDPVFKPAGA